MNNLCLTTVFILISPGEIYENVDLEIYNNAMKSQEQFMFDHSIPSNFTIVGENV